MLIIIMLCIHISFIIMLCIIFIVLIITFMNLIMRLVII
jgi:hypothetical protein